MSPALASCFFLLQFEYNGNDPTRKLPSTVFCIDFPIYTWLPFCVMLNGRVCCVYSVEGNKLVKCGIFKDKQHHTDKIVNWSARVSVSIYGIHDARITMKSSNHLVYLPLHAQQLSSAQFSLVVVPRRSASQMQINVSGVISVGNQKLGVFSRLVFESLMDSFHSERGLCLTRLPFSGE